MKPTAPFVWAAEELIPLRPERLYKRLRQGALHNVSFTDMCRLVERLGFQLVRVNGSHHIFAHPGVRQVVNLQDVAGQTKPYQIRQLLLLVEKYNLHPEEFR